MKPLDISEYDQHYFDGREYPPTHDAGYDSYQRWYYMGNSGLTEIWMEQALNITTKYNLVGKKVLEIGCAKGFLVEDMRTLGVDVYGIDCSSYAINCASDMIKQYLTVADAYDWINGVEAEAYDYVISLRFLNCIDVNNIPSLVGKMNRIAVKQVHIIDESPNPDYYISQTIEWWKTTYDFKPGTQIISRETELYLSK